MKIHHRRHILIAASVTMLIATLFVVAYIVWFKKPVSHIDVDRSQYPVKGIDISAHNGPIDFEQVASDTVDFVMIKATEGATFADSTFAANYAAAHDAGLKVGAYHFFRFDVSGDTQARHLLSTIGNRHLDLPLAIDLEEWTNPEDVDTQKVASQLNSMISRLRESGHNVIIYTNKKGYSRFAEYLPDDIDLWVSSVSRAPHEFKSWKLWQHSHEGKVKGINGNVDLNTFNGSRGQWNRWLAN